MSREAKSNAETRCELRMCINPLDAVCLVKAALHNLAEPDFERQKNHDGKVAQKGLVLVILPVLLPLKFLAARRPAKAREEQGDTLGVVIVNLPELAAQVI